MTSKKKSQKIFPIHVYQKRGPNFTISPIPAFEGHLLQIFWRSIIEAQANFPSVLAKILWSYGVWGGVPLDTQTRSSYATEWPSASSVG
jgi:hypothetical protein